MGTRANRLILIGAEPNMLLSVLIALAICAVYVTWDMDRDLIMHCSTVSTIFFIFASGMFSLAPGTGITLTSFIQSLALWIFCLFVLPRWMITIKEQAKDIMGELVHFLRQRQALILDIKRIERDKLELEYQQAMKEISS